jgi:hypothetical protein
VIAAGTLDGCGGGTTFVHTHAALGRVVVYRNGVAYFERTAHIEGDTLRLSVPADKVDDFLKSLTVVDAKTGEPAPIAYPTNLPSSGTGLIDMEIKLQGPSPHDLKLSYVTEAPSWKPSYRLVLGDQGKVALEGWAIIDNTSGEDWEDVNLGVGSSSALSFRFDLASVRTVRRDTLRADDALAIAPPTGGSVYGGEVVMGDFSDEKLNAAVAAADKPVVVASAPPPSAPYGGPGGYGGGGGYGRGATADAAKESWSPPATKKPATKSPPPSMPAATAMPSAPPPPPPSPADLEMDGLAARLKSTGKPVIVEGYAADTDGDKSAASLERANKMRAQLIKRGVDPANVTAVGKGTVPGRPKGGARVVDAPKDAPKGPAVDPGAGNREPIGTSHFDSPSRATVKRGTSAMVSILKSGTDGEIVYYYDAETPRGNASFPFKAVRVRNPTDSTLESGPVSVFGKGQFIGEGISEPIPPKQWAFVPFALDRQIVVEKTESDRDDIARILSCQRGVFQTEVKHVKKSKLTFHNRLPDKAKISVRHTVPRDYTLKIEGFTEERLGDAHLLGIEVDGGKSKVLEIEESTPVYRTIDLRTPTGLDMVKLYVSTAAAGPLKAEIENLVKLQQQIGNLEQRIATIREQQSEFRMRQDELHQQIFSLKLVKTGDPLMRDLEKKLQEVNERLTKSTIDLVNAQEELMLTKIRFQDAVSELTLDKDGKKTEEKVETKPDPKPVPTPKKPS